MSNLPLHGVRVLDFTTLLPGPLATLLLAEAGATIIKIEPPGGDAVRHQGPHDANGASVPFQMLNRGKQLRTLDLKTAGDRDRAIALARSADVLVEQFRPGVMDRLGLGAPALHALNPRLIYCSITGYGQSGPHAQRAGHDLNYAAEAGLLANVAAHDGSPVLPPTQIADIGGGSWPAVINILLALYRRGPDGGGCQLDIAMADNVWPFQLMPLAKYWATGAPSLPGSDPLVGGMPRYNLYATRDGRWLALGALEDRFLAKFAAIAGLQAAAPGRAGPSREAIAQRIREETAAAWLAKCEGEDVCLSLVRDIREAIDVAALDTVRAFAGGATAQRMEPPRLPLPLAPALRGAEPPAAAREGDHGAGWP
jgi:crotonobetainyl-CoA:carnitine CoA-transferase CaiB-like acyl-CoA transferase